MASFLLKLISGFNTPFNVINMVINTRKGAILLNPIKIRATGEIKAGRIDNMSIIRINPTVTASLFSRFSKTADLRLPTWGKFFPAMCSHREMYSNVTRDDYKYRNGAEY